LGAAPLDALLLGLVLFSVWIPSVPTPVKLVDVDDDRPVKEERPEDEV